MLNCELLETVARTLVPHMRAVKGNGKAINYLTPPRILLALLTAWLCRGRWSDEEVILLISLFQLITLISPTKQMQECLFSYLSGKRSICI